MSEILPNGTAAYYQEVEEVETPEDGIVRTVTETGEKASIDNRRTFYRSQALMFTSGISAIVYRSSNGRATLTVSYGRVAQQGEVYDDQVQELSGVDVVRDIKCSPYFAELTNDQVTAVQLAWDERSGAVSTWSNLQKSLYGHMAHGQESYVETAYEFRQVFQTTSTSQIRKAASNPNTVQNLPSLSPALSNLIDELPSGEWLKKPTTVQYAGKRGWTVSQTYQWAPKWSVIYGGTFTGLDA